MICVYLILAFILCFSQETQFLRQARDILSQIAVYVDETRAGEAKMNAMGDHSFVDDVINIQDTGLYHILCNIEVNIHILVRGG